MDNAAFDFFGYGAVHLIGAGGISMSGICELLWREGLSVTGSDAREGEQAGKLKSLGIEVAIGHSAANIPAYDCAVIYTGAVKGGNPELMEARSRGLRCFERSEALGAIMKNYARPVCVSGTHGKTTVTSMISEICMAAGLNPTLMIGGVLPSVGGAFKYGGRDVLIAEACEYRDSFLSFKPYISVILNIEKDHTDYFKDLGHIRRSFSSFAALPPKGGAVVINAEIPDYLSVTASSSGGVIPFGPAGDGTGWGIEDLSFDGFGFPSFMAVKRSGGSKITETAVSLKTPGAYNAKNAIAAMAAADYLGVSAAASAKALASFSGAKRRYEPLGTAVSGARVIDDYAHHPSEIKAALSAASAAVGKSGKGKLWVAFQSHTKERTFEQLDEFAGAFGDADEVIILDIYAPAGREWEDVPVSGEDLAAKIKEGGKGAVYIPSFEDARVYIEERTCADDIVIVMGAGDVDKLGRMLTERG